MTLLRKIGSSRNNRVASLFFIGKEYQDIILYQSVNHGSQISLSRGFRHGNFFSKS